MPADTAGSPPYPPSAVITTRVSSMPRLAASRNRSLDTQPATARCSSCPPLKPRPPPPASAGLSTTRVCGPAAPSAVTAPSTFLTSTSKPMPVPPLPHLVQATKLAPRVDVTRAARHTTDYLPWGAGVDGRTRSSGTLDDHRTLCQVAGPSREDTH